MLNITICHVYLSEAVCEFYVAVFLLAESLSVSESLPVSVCNGVFPMVSLSYFI